jgi:predicted nucleotidyltransferase
MKDIVQKFCGIAKRKYGKQIEKMILFGSFARGDKSKDSDIDLLIVWRGNKKMPRII